MKTGLAPLLALLFFYFPAAAQPANLITNSSLEEGTNSPSAWILSGSGEWTTDAQSGSRSLCVTDDGTQDSFWRYDSPPVRPGRVYRLSFYAKGTGSGSCGISGLNVANFDFQPSEQWSLHSFTFTTPKDLNDVFLRLGQWSRRGTIWFDAITLAEVHPRPQQQGPLLLGEGESLHGNQYRFAAPLAAKGTNYSRPLLETTTGFNSDRWTFGPGTYVVYKHQIGPARIEEARISIQINYYLSGSCQVEAGTDGRQWQSLGQLEGKKDQAFPLPAELLPAPVIYVRLISSGSFQIDRYGFEARLNQSFPQIQGSTFFLQNDTTSDRLAVTILSLDDLLPGDDKNLRCTVQNKTDKALALVAELAIRTAGGTPQPIAAPSSFLLSPQQTQEISLPYTLRSAGEFTLDFALRRGPEVLYQASTPFRVPSLYDGSYGYHLEENESLQLWWCESTYKVSRQRPAPSPQSQKPVQIAAARGEYEPVQIVLRPKKNLEGVQLAVVSENPLWQDAFQLYQVYYHYIHHATDALGCVGWWPDALPAWNEPLNLTGGENQPGWLLVKVPLNCPAGDHQVQVTIRAKDMEPVTLPVQIHVYDFEMPASPHIVSAFGLDAGPVNQYHNLQTAEEQRQVWDLYLQSFREHRLTPYNFAPYDPIQVHFECTVWEGGQIVSEDPAGGQSCLKLIDENPSQNVACSTSYLIPVTKDTEYRLAWKAKTQNAGQEYQVTLSTCDAEGRWISGHNLDLAYSGSGQWQSQQTTLIPTQRSPQAAFVKLSLWPVLWKEGGSTVGTAWFDDISLAQAGDDTNLIRNPGFELDNFQPNVTVDFTRWDQQARQYLDEYGFTSFRLDLQGMGSGCQFGTSLGQIGPFPQGSPQYRQIFQKYCLQLQNHLEQRGWLDKAYIYWFDEPEPKDYEFVKNGMEEIKLAGPKLPRMLTEEPGEHLAGSVDIWCPILHMFDPAAAAQRQQLGEKIWWYVCTGPKQPYPGLFIDHDAVELRIWQWMSWKWNVQGILVWASNYWSSPCAFPSPKTQNPWQDPMSYVSGYGGEPTGYIGYWGNGDGRFLYPVNRDVENDKRKFLAGPVSSFRWEMLREGLEDYEYFWILKDLVNKARTDEKSNLDLQEIESLLTVPENIVADLTTFTRDPQPLYQYRAKLAEAIETLSRRP